jgi:hypothetical protein
MDINGLLQLHSLGDTMAVRMLVMECEVWMFGDWIERKVEGLANLGPPL